MSSEGSVTSTASRIRQFGLYRTIDARTDEFLRSSRRRQIRQGCACAAISTAITVTVVVSVILVYEYSINSESNVNKKLTVKPNWLGLMNESDTTQSDMKFEKKINFDRTTLKLLPILIKALNKNRYLEKIIEDYSSSSPPYEEGNETENYFQRNVFSNSKNWLKMPSSKGYTIDHKSSPSLYTRRPTVYSDYLSRIRKLRNYKRMLNNFDKVTSERTSYPKPSQTPKTIFAYTSKPLKSVTHRMKPNKTKPVKSTMKNKSNGVKISDVMVENLSNKGKNVSKPVPTFPEIENKKLNKHKGYCKCPRDMGILLNKLIQSIKEMIPTMTNKNQSYSSCPNKEKKERNKKKSIKKSRIHEDITISTTQQAITKSTTLKIIIKPMIPVAMREGVYDTITEPVNVKNITTPHTQIDIIDLPAFKFDHDITTELTTISSLNTSTSESITYATASNLDKKYPTGIANNHNVYINTIQAHKNILEQIPMYGTYDLKDLNYEISTSDAEDKSISNNINKKSSTTTELIMPLKLNSHSNEGSLSSEHFLDSVAVVSNYKHPIRPLLNDKEYEDYLTTQGTPNDFDDLDVHSFELVKTKNVISSPTKYERNRFRNNMKKVPITSRNYHPVAKSKDTDQINMRKMADLINIPKTMIDQENARRLSLVYEDESFGNTNFITRNDEETGLLKNIIKISKSETLSKISHQPLSKTESTLLQAPDGDQNNENTNEDEFQEEWTKNTEVTESSIKYNKSIFDDEPQTSQNNYESKSHDKINSVKSMLPAIRPVYLEIRRSNDWKTEDHTDYDVILLIYEYTIAVEWTLVQNKNDIVTESEIFKNQPIADRLDRTDFGFDQEYFEKMPLLINALQENNYIDPTLEMTDLLGKKKHIFATVLKTTTKPTLKTSATRRTIPRPFYFKYRYPTPLPFSKTYGSRSWVERYRNEERLKNIRQIIKYLENSIHAKVGDMHAKSTEQHVDFTGLSTESMPETNNEESNKSDLVPASSDIKKRYLNHLADPLFNFKPENPGDVNLLADKFLRFAPVATPDITSKTNEYPMFRQIPLKNRNCHGNKCEEIIEGNNKLFPRSTIINQTETPPLSTTKSFSVMLNLFPIKSKSGNLNQDILTTTQTLDKIYLTTSRPLLQFKRKSNVSIRRIYTPYKRPRYLSDLINKDSKSNKTKETVTPGTQMIFDVKAYNEHQVKNEISEKTSTISIPLMQTNPYTTRAPIEFSTSQIEDYHVGSSGYIPVPNKTDKSLPKITTMLNFFDTTTEYSNTARTQTSSAFKFNIQDAKVPNHYLNLNTKVNKGNINRRNSMGFIDHEELFKQINENLKLNGINLSNPIDTNVENNTLIVKLKNNYTNNVAESTEANTEEITTSVNTYVPHINGHYRSINQNSRNVNEWLNDEPEKDRKNRLQNVVSDIRPYVPMYVEIIRNNTKTSNIGDTVTTTQETRKVISTGPTGPT
ncbi:unnamed protein product [Arctia plantaginis]|uniref:Uncharacterized protein n=1 Tax=Arctia plantaginis TaxID=874455 RepID=A0A8S1BF76_ARCPL|nr:unnamed protein product [Arctia plantaginis]